jgi:alpha-tubulin suppressor-like RCC1 family protein
MMNAGKWSTRLMGLLLRVVTVLVLAIASLPAAPLGEANARTSPFVIPAIAVTAAPSQPALTQIVAGGTHSCALTPEGGVVCWGANWVGQLGNESTTSSAVPVQVTGLQSGVMGISLGGYRTCALTTHGQVFCWGNYANGPSSSTTPVLVSGVGNQVIQVATGENHTCVLTLLGSVLCWGYNTYGQLGNGTSIDSLTPVVAIAAGAAQIAIQSRTSCAVMTNGEVQCWGDGRRGQLGDGVADPDHESNVPVHVLAVGGSPLVGASQVELGLVFGCALVGSGVHCWGMNRFGQLGNGVIQDESRPFAGPVLIAAGGAALSGADQITTGESFACVHLTSGQVQCWGNNQMGQHGNGGVVDSGVPVTVRDTAGTAPLEGVVRVTTGLWHTCIFTNWEAEHPFYCWGNNNMGQLGAGSVPDIYPLPQPVADISGLGGGFSYGQQIVAGGAHTCALTTGGGLKCWGSNTLGQLGDGSSTDSLIPVDVAGLSSDVQSIALGDKFTCALLPWGRLKCWGENTHGQLGTGSTISSSLPAFAILPDVAERQVAAGDSHVCVLTLAGSVLCWGDNTYGQLGDGSTTESASPVTATLGSNAVEIALGGATSCAVMSSGGVKCWGLGDVGQLGDGGSGGGHKQTTATDVQVSGGGVLTGATQVAVGANYGCALLEGGLVDCWGKNDAGQLGRGITSTLSAFAMPVVTALDGSPLQGATQVTAGGAHACVRMYTDRLKCWGQGETGQLGDGSSGVGASSALPHTVVDHYEPYATSIPYLEGVSQVSAGGAHTCAFLKWDGSNPYRCWGDNSSGQLGDGGGTSAGQSANLANAAIQPYPTLVADSLRFGSPPLAKIAAGGLHTCALTQAGGVKCWGDNTHGQLGDGTNTKSMLPVGVVGLSSGVIGLVAGDLHVCALTSAGGVNCWGENTRGQLGDGTNINSNTPVSVVGLANGVIALAAGGTHTCALTNAGGVKCWGANDYGQLGNGTNDLSNTPVDVSTLGNGMIGLSLGWGHSCGLTQAGGVKCWGYNDKGQLGDDSTNTNSSTPVNVSGLASGVIRLAAGFFHTCALTQAEGVKCWGSNDSGQLGDSTNLNSSTPVYVTGLSVGVTNLSAGRYHSCALISIGGVKCWGTNTEGQLGDGTWADSRNTPVDVIGLLSGVTSLAAGGHHTCAVLAGTGPLRCWGRNSYGQLGTGDLIDTDEKGPVVSRWLTANGLVEDQKGEVIILPNPNTALVIPAQPLTTTVLITATELISSSIPAPCTNCTIPPDAPVIDVTVSSPVMVTVRWHIHFPNWPPTTRLQSASAIDEESLNVYHYKDGTWIPILPCTGCSLDTINHVLIANLTDEGIYAMMAIPHWDIYLPLVMRSP